MAQPLQRRRHQISAKLPRLAALAGKGRGNHNSTNRPRRSPRLKPTQNSDSAIQFDTASKAKYATLRGRGHSHGRALRSVADRLLNVACAMLKNGTLFNPSLKAQMTPC